MEESQRQELLQLTSDFYAAHADSFSATRQTAWASWDQALDGVKFESVLDIGCGNGRFGKYLPDCDYTGADSSAALIDIARSDLPAAKFHVEPIDETLQRSEHYDLAVAFGVMHHLPDAGYRQSVVKRMLEMATTIVVSLWQPALLDNFESKVSKDLGGGDYLLGWGSDFSTLRYCHSFDEAEVDELARLGNVAKRFSGHHNDRTNHYLVLTKPWLVGGLEQADVLLGSL